MLKMFNFFKFKKQDSQKIFDENYIKIINEIKKVNLNQYGIIGHATNAYSLKNILETNREVLPSKEAQKYGKLVLSGESFGKTKLNSQFVSVVILASNSSYYNLIDYANKASNLGEKGYVLTPNNIILKIKEYERDLEYFASEKAIGNVEFWKNITIHKLEHANKIKEIFLKMPSKKRDEIDKLSKIRIAVLGIVLQKNLKLVNGISGAERCIDKFHVRYIVVDSSNYSQIAYLIKEHKELLCITFEQLEKISGVKIYDVLSQLNDNNKY